MRTLFVVGIVSAALAGCQTAADGLTTGSTPIVISGPAASAIAGDITSRFAEQVPPASTTIQIKQDKTDFSVALEAALKGWGYTVTTSSSSADPKAIRLAYALDGLDGQLLAQLSTPSIAVSRVYAASSTGATPASPLSVMQRN